MFYKASLTQQELLILYKEKKKEGKKFNIPFTWLQYDIIENKEFSQKAITSQVN